MFDCGNLWEGPAGASLRVREPLARPCACRLHVCICRAVPGGAARACWGSRWSVLGFKNSWTYSAMRLGVTRVSLTDMWPSTTLLWKPNASCCCPTRATWLIRDTLVFVRTPSNVSSFVLTVISNENSELSYATPETATRTPEAPTLATHLLPMNWGVLVSPNWSNTSTQVLGVRRRYSRCPNWTVSHESYCRKPSRSLVLCKSGQSIMSTLLVDSKMTLRLLWWPSTEYTMCIDLQMVCPYSCMIIIVFWWE